MRVEFDHVPGALLGSSSASLLWLNRRLKNPVSFLSVSLVLEGSDFVSEGALGVLLLG